MIRVKDDYTQVYSPDGQITVLSKQFDYWRVPMVSKDLLPKSSGVYILNNHNLDVLYVGQTFNFRKRWKTHHLLPTAKDSDRITVIKIYTRLDDAEVELIKRFSPPLNRQIPIDCNINPSSPESHALIAIALNDERLNFVDSWVFQMLLADPSITQTKLTNLWIEKINEPDAINVPDLWVEGATTFFCSDQFLQVSKSIKKLERLKYMTRVKNMKNAMTLFNLDIVK